MKRALIVFLALLLLILPLSSCKVASSGGTQTTAAKTDALTDQTGDGTSAPAKTNEERTAAKETATPVPKTTAGQTDPPAPGTTAAGTDAPAPSTGTDDDYTKNY